jgi:hypothetical protein
LYARFAGLLALLVLILSAGPLAGDAYAGSKLKRIKEKVKSKSKSKPKKDRDSKKSRGLFDEDEEDDDEEGPIDGLVEELASPVFVMAIRATWWGLSSPFWVPACVVGDEPGRPYRFEKFPYAGESQGYHRIPKLVPGKEEEPGKSRSAASEDDELRWPFGRPHRWDKVEGRKYSVRALYTLELDSGDVLGHRLELIARTYRRVNIDLSVTDYAEEVEDQTEHLQHYQGHLTYSFAVSERVHFAAGAGFRVLGWEGGGGEGGLDFRYEAELFPVKPLHLHFIAEAGWVGGQGAWELEARIGALFRRAQLFVGYRHFRVAGEDLNGPIFGVAFWF